MPIPFAFALGLAASGAAAARPELVYRRSHQAVHEGAGGVDDQKYCFLQKDDKRDGVGHQLFGMLTIMGAHGVVGDDGTCHVYNALPRNFTFGHMRRVDEAGKEAMALMTGFYGDFVSKVGAKGCATAELLAKAPKGRAQPVNQNPKLLTDVCKDHAWTTWQLDNLEYPDYTAFRHRQLVSKPTGFMEAVVKNASQLAALAVPHLPRVADVPTIAVHMRFGDRAANLLPVAEGQQLLFQRPEFQSLVSGPASVRLFSDAADDAKPYLTGTAIAGAKLCGGNCSTMLQAVASMVAADVFVGSYSDMSSSAALMRIGMGKKHTYMPSCWQWAHAFLETEVTIYNMADHHQEGCHEHCDPDQPDWCYWCGRHQTDLGLKWMHCCKEGASYAPDHNCHGAAFNPGLAEQHQCVVMPERLGPRGEVLG